MKIALIAASMLVLGMAGQSFAQDQSSAPQQDSNTDHKPAAVVAPDQAEAVAVGGISTGAVVATVAVVGTALAIGASKGGSAERTSHGTGGGTTGTH